MKMENGDGLELNLQLKKTKLNFPTQCLKDVISRHQNLLNYFDL